MLKKIQAIIAAFCVIAVFGACGSTEQTSAETTARTRETTTAAATTTSATTTSATTTSAATTAEPETEETTAETNAETSDTEYYEEQAEIVGIKLNFTYDLFGNNSYGFTSFYDDGTVEIEIVDDDYYEEGTWTVTDGELTVNMPEYDELPVVVIGDGDAVMIGESDAIVAIRSEFYPPAATAALLSDDRDTYMDIITLSEDAPGLMYWMDLDDDGNTLGEGEGTFRILELDDETYFFFAIDDASYNGGEEPVIMIYGDGVLTDGTYTWTQQDLESYE
jgi:hypothetical protein